MHIHTLKTMLKTIQFAYSTTAHFYKLLGISMSASAQQIKAAYYKKAKEHHPDITQGSSIKFNQINNAYNQLMSKVKVDQRKQTKNQNQHKTKTNNTNKSEQQSKKDKKWTNYQNKDFDWNQYYDWEQRQFGRSSRNTRNQRSWDFQEKQFHQFEKAFNSYLRYGYLKQKYKKFKPYIDELFKNDFGFQYSQKQYGQKQYGYANRDDADQQQWEEQEQETKSRTKVKDKHKPKKLDITYHLHLQQKDLGETVRIKFQRQLNCPKCSDRGKQGYIKIICKQCQRSGELDKKCQKCKGKGYTLKYDCRSCRNTGTVKKIVEEVVIVPAGLQNGSRIVMEGRGHQHKRKGVYGDLIVYLDIDQDEDESPKSKNKKKKNGSAYQVQKYVQIDIFEAVLGCITTIRSGKGLTQVKIPAGVQPGDSIKNNSGNRDPKNFKINIIVPEKITAKQKQIYEKLRQLKSKK